MCACSAADSFQSLTIWLTSNIASDPYLPGLPFHGVVTGPELGRVQQYTQNLTVVLRSTLCRDQPGDEDQNSARQTMHKVKTPGTREQRDKKQAPLGSQNGQRAIHNLENPVRTHSGWLREEPGHEICGADSHVDPEDDAGKDPL